MDYFILWASCITSEVHWIANISESGPKPTPPLAETGYHLFPGGFASGRSYLVNFDYYYLVCRSLIPCLINIVLHDLKTLKPYCRQNAYWLYIKNRCYSFNGSCRASWKHQLCFIRTRVLRYWNASHLI